MSSRTISFELRDMFAKTMQQKIPLGIVTYSEILDVVKL